jgi:eukaryotic-like serine/threonine-protein kinase
LQFTASKLWEKRDRAQKLLTQASYRLIGGVSGALATHADDVIAHLTPRAQLLAERVFRRLVTPDRTRAA